MSDRTTLSVSKDTRKDVMDAKPDRLSTDEFVAMLLDEFNRPDLQLVLQHIDDLKAVIPRRTAEELEQRFK